MNNITLLLTALFMLLVVPNAAATQHSSAAEAKAGVTFEEFVNMSLEERIEVCARLVNADAIGECVTVRKPTNKPSAYIDEERIKAEVFRCADEMKTTDIQQLAACARQKLNEGSRKERPVVTEAQIAKAEEFCSKHYKATNEFGSCVSGILRHIDHEGNVD